MYDGLEDYFDHLMHFCQIMSLQGGNNALMCKVFLSSLVSPAMLWFHHLLPNTVTSFCCVRPMIPLVEILMITNQDY